MTIAADILHALQTRGDLTARQLSELCRVTRKQAKSGVCDLVRRGLVEQVGELEHPGDRRGPSEKVYRVNGGVE